jgi:hypothetical protein
VSSWSNHFRPWSPLTEHVGVAQTNVTIVRAHWSSYQAICTEKPSWFLIRDQSSLPCRVVDRASIHLQVDLVGLASSPSSHLQLCGTVVLPCH